MLHYGFVMPVQAIGGLTRQREGSRKRGYNCRHTCVIKVDCRSTVTESCPEWPFKINSPKPMPNRLIHEQSPYLLQHAHNPVDWYPWGPEAFAAARATNKPIFLSVGYSTCYWCHVMERQSFENPAIAEEMNRHFICVKVDREERPDVDCFYMNAVQVLTHRGGWPMSVFLTPDGRPFYGGTYYPPADQHGMPGFLTILSAIDQAWQGRRDQVEQSCEQLMGILRQISRPPAPRRDLTLDADLTHELVRRSTADYEPQFGGFGSAPKFPRQTLLELVLVYLQARPDAKDRSRLSGALRHTLDAMADGGIHDHLGGGFHRYSTDASWLVPHFEIMLYDNAMLAWVYAEASRAGSLVGAGCVPNGEGEGAGAAARYTHIAREICMTSPQGAFYTAFDAEVDACEGEPYLWTAAEVDEVLGPVDGALFARLYGLDQGPNFSDPHQGSGRPEKNVLFRPRPIAQAAVDLGMTEAALEASLREMRHKLLTTRRQRKQPLLDTKIITSWNALMIRSLAFCGRILHEPRYIEAARCATEFLLSVHRRADGSLWRTSRDGTARHDACLDDYALLAQALLELHEATGETQWKSQAVQIAEQMIARFGDLPSGDASADASAPDPSAAPSQAAHAFFFTPADAADVPLRQQIAHDSPLPSGNAIAARVCIKLGRLDLAAGVLRTFARQLVEQVEAMSSMATALIEYLAVAAPLHVTAAPQAGRPMTPEELADEVVELHAAWANPRQLHILFRIRDGWHINSNPAGRDLTPTQVAVLGDAAPTVALYKYPEPRRLNMAGGDIAVFDGDTVVEIHFKGDMTGIGPLLLSAVYQACDTQRCLPVRSKQFELNTP